MTLAGHQLIEGHRVAFDQTQDHIAEPMRIRPVVPAERRFVQVRGRVVEERPDTDGELVAATVTFELPAPKPLVEPPLPDNVIPLRPRP